MGGPAMTPYRYTVDGDLVALTADEEAAWLAEQASFAAEKPVRIYTGAEIIAAIGRWGAVGEIAAESLPTSQYGMLFVGNIPATHTALVALLSAAGKTEADL